LLPADSSRVASCGGLVHRGCHRGPGGPDRPRTETVTCRPRVSSTLRVLRRAWETAHGRGSGVGLAPSAHAAHELATAVGIGCETITRWLTETTGPAAQQRTALLNELTRRRSTAAKGQNRLAREMNLSAKFRPLE
jgi:hypothetical protein